MDPPRRNGSSRFFRCNTYMRPEDKVGKKLRIIHKKPHKNPKISLFPKPLAVEVRVVRQRYLPRICHFFKNKGKLQ